LSTHLFLKKGTQQTFIRTSNKNSTRKSADKKVDDRCTSSVPPLSGFDLFKIKIRHAPKKIKIK
jgi:hypothetical protein